MSSPPYRSRRRAFTLIELLVVVAIIGVLVSLLLPAVQAARESARRTQCASQIKQLALAVLNYESAQKKLPASGIAEIQVDNDRSIELFNAHGGPQFSWIVLLLPHLEQAALSTRFDMTRRVYFQTSDPQAESIPLLECPSEGHARTPYSYWNNLSHKAFAKGNYAAYASPFHVDLQMLYRGAFIAGGQPLAAIADGSVNTLAIAEVRTLDREDDWRGVWAAPWTGATLLAFDMHPAGTHLEDGGAGEPYAAATNAPYVASPHSVGKTQSPNCQGPNRDTIPRCEDGRPLDHAAEAAGMPCMASKAEPGLTGHDSAAPRSLHPGGVNGAHLDGHVEFLTNEIDDFVMAYRVSINDGSIENER